MDLVKIGSYIAEKRKKLGMTQKQLASGSIKIVQSKDAMQT